MCQHIVYIAEQRHFILCDNPYYPLYPFMIDFSHINRFSETGGYFSFFEKQLLIVPILRFLFPAAGLILCCTKSFDFQDIMWIYATFCKLIYGFKNNDVLYFDT